MLGWASLPAVSPCLLPSKGAAACSRWAFEASCPLTHEALDIHLQQAPLSSSVFSFAHAEPAPKLCTELFISSVHNKVFYALCYIMSSFLLLAAVRFAALLVMPSSAIQHCAPPGFALWLWMALGMFRRAAFRKPMGFLGGPVLQSVCQQDGLCSAHSRTLCA